MNQHKTQVLLPITMTKKNKKNGSLEVFGFYYRYFLSNTDLKRCDFDIRHFLFFILYIPTKL